MSFNKGKRRENERGKEKKEKREGKKRKEKTERGKKRVRGRENGQIKGNRQIELTARTNERTFSFEKCLEIPKF